MYCDIPRDREYIDSLKDFIAETYGIRATAVTPAKRGYYGETWKHYIVDWDEVMYAPLERDVWVMCCHAWARELFDNTLREHGIAYQLRPERLAFYCYHMFFFYLDEFMECLPFWDMSERVQGYLEDGWIEERTLFADTI